MAKKSATQTAQATPVTPVVQLPPAEELVEEPEDVEETTEQTEDKKTRARRAVTKDSFFQSLAELASQVENEITKLSSVDKPKGLRFIKRVRKALHVVESDARKLLKVKNANKKNGSVSGFMKPVLISEEMATFTGLNKDDAYPRPQITSAICKYIETNSLQNPQDRREFRVDGSLQKLLRYNPANPPKDEQGNVIPMTYFRLQKYMQHHFHPVVVATPAEQPDTPVVVTPAPVVTPVVPVVPVATPASTGSKRKAK
jgi:chromatin remodeling complex protein RSC6